MSNVFIPDSESFPMRKGIPEGEGEQEGESGKEHVRSGAGKNLHDGQD